MVAGACITRYRIDRGSTLERSRSGSPHDPFDRASWPTMRSTDGTLMVARSAPSRAPRALPRGRLFMAPLPVAWHCAGPAGAGVDLPSRSGTWKAKLSPPNGSKWILHY
jgi:hypothetical protein